MKGWSVFQRGKRELHTRKKVRFLPLLLVAAMLSGMLLISSVGAEGIPTDSKNQVTYKGETLCYTSKGVPVSGQQGYDVSVNKTVTQAVDGSGNPIENRFKVDLAVETTTDYTTIETTKDAAVVLVLDFSDSMNDCAECGRTDFPPTKWPESAGYGDYGRAQAHIKPDSTAQYYCGPKCVSDKSGIYTPSYGGSKCTECGKEFALGTNHFLQHKFVTRWNVAKQNTLDFINKYVSGAKGAKRYLSVVTFSDGVGIPVSMQDFTGKSTEDIKKIVDNTIFTGMGNDTNTTAGMLAALNIISGTTQVPKNQCSVILMTDGLPGQKADLTEHNYSGKNFAAEYKALQKYCEENSNNIADFTSYKNALYNTAQLGFAIRDLGASLYTVGFATGYYAHTYPAEYLAKIMEKFADKGYDANSAAGLGDAFTDIIKKMTELKPNTVTDVLPTEFKYVPNTFTGKGATVSDNGTISWVLTKLVPDSSADGHHTYKLSYEMTLDNLKTTYANGVATLRVNSPQQAPTFGFTPYTDDQPSGPMQTVKFAIPEVKCYSDDFAFTKVDPQMVVIPKSGVTEGGTFTLTTADDLNFKKTVTTNEKGVVSFASIPSGHAYVLTETKAPLEFALGDKTTWGVEVGWGVASSEVLSGTIYQTLADKTANKGETANYVVNKYDPAENSFAVQKVWEDDTGYYKKQGTTVEFEVECKLPNSCVVATKTGSMTYADRHSDNDRIWETTVTLPTRDVETGAPLEYALTETNAQTGWTVKTATETTPFLIQNTIPNSIDITVTKVWEDVENFTDTHPLIEIYLYNDDTDTKVKTATLTDPATTVTFPNMPTQDNQGNPITYRVGEQAKVAGYRWTGNTGNQEIGFTLTNSSLELEKTSYTVHKHWYDDNNALEKRPDSVTVRLEQHIEGETDGNAAEEWTDTGETVELSDANLLEGNENIWVGEFTDLPQYTPDDPKKEITYRAREVTVTEGYHTSYSGIDINNTYNVTSVTAHKIWVKPTSVEAPTVTFELLQNGQPYKSGDLLATETEYVFSGLPKLDNSGAAYTYTVRETVAENEKDHYTQTSLVNTTFTNTIDQRYDVTVAGQIRWELRNEPESVLPEQLVVQLYAGGKPCTYPEPFPQNPDMAGQNVTRVANAANGWTYEFKNAQRYTNDRTGVIDYSVRELSYNDIPAADKSTIELLSVGESTPRSFGVHYETAVHDPVTGEVTYKISVRDPITGNFTCDIRNHTDAEATDYSYRIDRTYTYKLDNVSTPIPPVTGEVVAQAAPFPVTFNTGDAAYKVYNGKTYGFVDGTVTIGAGRAADPAGVAAGEYTVEIAKNDGMYVITLNYALSETTYVPPYVPDDPGPSKPPKPTDPTEPTTPPTPPTDPTEPPTPPTDPTTPPTDPTTPPTDPTTPPKPPKDPDIRPDPPVLPPDVQDKVDEVIKDVTEHPEHIIKDKDSFEEMFPEVTIEDLPPPLYWGLEFAVVDVPIYEEIVAIDSELVPLGSLPQTGSNMRDIASCTALAGMAAIVLAGSAALGGWLVLRRKRTGE